MVSVNATPSKPNGVLAVAASQTAGNPRLGMYYRLMEPAPIPSEVKITPDSNDNYAQLR